MNKTFITNQKLLAGSINVTPEYLCNIVNGKRFASEVLLCKIANVTQLSLDKLVRPHLYMTSIKALLMDFFKEERKRKARFKRSMSVASGNSAE